MDLQSLTLDVHQQIDIKAPIHDVFEGLIRQFTEAMSGASAPMPMKLERRPGGRWYRDLGNDSGHLWGFVQSIKAPTLLELVGPMFMSYPVSGHVIMRLSESGGVTRVDFRHRAFGFIEENHRAGVTHGWREHLEGVKRFCEK